jgi:hypothetical protein
MKKVIVAAVLLVMILCGACVAETLTPGTYVAGSNFPSGWYSVKSDDGLELSPVLIPEGCSVAVVSSLELESLDETRTFTVAPGMYVVGEDIPAGEYSVRCAEGEHLFNIYVHDEDGHRVFSDGFWADKNEYLGKIVLLDGYSVSTNQGKAYFSAPAGIVFD